MYTPALFKEEDLQRTYDLIRQNSFATLITPQGARLEISHLPLILDLSNGRKVIKGHMARANSHWKAFAGQTSTAIFHGPHTYITPSWYADPMNVPTWNYASVHVTGSVKLIEGDAELKTLLDETVKFFEGESTSAWRMDSLPEEFVGKLGKGIVGFELEVFSLESKFKLSQNRSEADRAGVLQGLKTRSDEMSQQVLRLMTEKP